MARRFWSVSDDGRLGAWVCAWALVTIAGCGGDGVSASGADGGTDVALGGGQANTETDAGSSEVPTGMADAAIPTASDAGACGAASMSIDPAILPECPMCAGARCVPVGLVPAAQAGQLADCPNAGGKCVPDVLVATMGNYAPTVCRSLLGAEGRCLSACIPAVGDQADRLPRDVCADGELCAPCFDPITGKSSGACSLGCDPGPAEPPLLFNACCGDLAVCVPDAFVPGGQRDSLVRDTCAKGELCAPRVLAQDAAYVPPSCASLGGGEGRCLTACLPGIARQADRLERGTCTAGHLCAPCYDPLTGADTGACSVGGDPGPAEEPYVFPGCCQGASSGTTIGLCVPDALVGDDQRDSLGRDTCDEGFSCAPRMFIDATMQPEPCASLDRSEGRCLPACLPAVAVQADRLPQDICPDDFLCVPCFDPFSGADSGACALNGDAPVDPPYTFPGCCEATPGQPLGVCLDPALVPDAQQTALGQDSCAFDRLCVPLAFTDANSRPAPCTSFLDGFEGRCLPACLPALAAQGNRLHQDGCAAGLVCAPCYDPITGVDSNACRTHGDVPATTADANVFARCCQVTGGLLRGYCVPKHPDLIPMDQWGNLPSDTCSQSPIEHLCVPDVKIEDPSASFPGCTTSVAVCIEDGSVLIGSGSVPSGTSGVCMPECMQAPNGPVPSDVIGGRGNCQQGEICVPCEVTQCAFDGCTLCIAGSCRTGACGDTGTCP